MVYIKPLTILDVGCGDASQSVNLFNGCHVQEYVGCDLSPFALDLAKQQLVAMNTQVSLWQQDVISCMQQLDKKFDVILCSYVLHHYSLAQKQTFFEQAARLLGEHGVLMYIDLVRVDTETRAEFIDNYLGYAGQNWLQLVPAEQQAIAKHVHTYDFPETSAALTVLASSVGLVQLKQMPGYTWHQAIVFGKQA